MPGGPVSVEGLAHFGGRQISVALYAWLEVLSILLSCLQHPAMMRNSTPIGLQGHAPRSCLPPALPPKPLCVCPQVRLSPHLCPGLPSPPSPCLLHPRACASPQGPAIPMIRRHAKTDRGEIHFEPALRVVSGNYVTAKRRGVIDGVDFAYTGEVTRTLECG